MSRWQMKSVNQPNNKRSASELSQTGGGITNLPFGKTHANVTNKNQDQANG